MSIERISGIHIQTEGEIGGSGLLGDSLPRLFHGHTDGNYRRVEDGYGGTHDRMSQPTKHTESAREDHPISN